jgi:hypothetical protein
MNLAEFKIVVSNLAKRWPDVQEEWWVEDVWNFSKELPLRALEFWVRSCLSNQRQMPLPGDFKKYWWDNSKNYPEEGKSNNHVGCKECKHTGFIFAARLTDDIPYEYVFRCDCNSRDTKLKLWSDYSKSPDYELSRSWFGFC